MRHAPQAGPALSALLGLLLCCCDAGGLAGDGPHDLGDGLVVEEGYNNNDDDVDDGFVHQQLATAGDSRGNETLGWSLFGLGGGGAACCNFARQPVRLVSIARQTVKLVSFYQANCQTCLFYARQTVRFLLFCQTNCQISLFLPDKLLDWSLLAKQNVRLVSFARQTV